MSGGIVHLRWEQRGVSVRTGPAWLLLMDQWCSPIKGSHLSAPTQSTLTLFPRKRHPWEPEREGGTLREHILQCCQSARKKENRDRVIEGWRSEERGDRGFIRGCTSCLTGLTLIRHGTCTPQEKRVTNASRFAYCIHTWHTENTLSACMFSAHRHHGILCKMCSKFKKFNILFSFSDIFLSLLSRWLERQKCHQCKQLTQSLLSITRPTASSRDQLTVTSNNVTW